MSDLNLITKAYDNACCWDILWDLSKQAKDPAVKKKINDMSTRAYHRYEEGSDL